MQKRINIYIKLDKTNANSVVSIANYCRSIEALDFRIFENKGTIYKPHGFPSTVFLSRNTRFENKPRMFHRTMYCTNNINVYFLMFLRLSLTLIANKLPLQNVTRLGEAGC